MNKHKITYIQRENKTSKNGKPYERVTIKTDREADKFLSGFGGAETRDWEVGSEVEITVTPVQSADGKKTFFNFDYPRKPKLEDRVGRLEIELDMLKRFIKQYCKPRQSEMTTSAGTPVPFPVDEDGLESLTEEELDAMLDR